MASRRDGEVREWYVCTSPCVPLSGFSHDLPEPHTTQYHPLRNRNRVHVSADGSHYFSKEDPDRAECRYTVGLRPKVKRPLVQKHNDYRGFPREEMQLLVFNFDGKVSVKLCGELYGMSA